MRDEGFVDKNVPFVTALNGDSYDRHGLFPDIFTDSLRARRSFVKSDPITGSSVWKDRREDRDRHAQIVDAIVTEAHLCGDINLSKLFGKAVLEK